MSLVESYQVMYILTIAFVLITLVMNINNGSLTYVFAATLTDQVLRYNAPNDTVPQTRFTPDWQSLDSRPTPDWYDDAKFGIFIHWGLFSVPAFKSEWFWHRLVEGKDPDYKEFMDRNYLPGFKYGDFAPKFQAKMFHPSSWLDIIVASRAKYVVFTSKHHDGFTNWPSKYSHGWNSVDTGPGRDLLGELEEAVRRYGLKFGIYHSLFEWFHPLYLQDENNSFNTNHFVQAKSLPCLHELVTKYKPDILWSDGEGGGDSTYWNSTDFLAWLYNDSPVKDSVVVNDRWGSDTRCRHGDYLTCADDFRPGKIQPSKWERCMTIDKQSWGYRRNARVSELLPPEELVATLVETVSCGGNLLMNIGPTAEGLIPPIYEERLSQVGSWLAVNKQAIFRTKPWREQKDPTTETVWYTEAKYTNITTVYATMLQWPKSSKLTLSGVEALPGSDVKMLGLARSLTWSMSEGQVTVDLPLLTPDEFPCKYAWVLQFQNVQ